MEPVEFLLGKESSEYLRVRVLRRSHPGTTDYWDGNWIRSEMTLTVDTFHGEVVGDLRTDELAHLRSELARLYQELGGEGVFANLDGHLDFDIRGDGIGHFALEGGLRHDPGSGNQLLFRLELDQTQIPLVLSQLDAILAAYPVLGSPSD